MTRDGQKKEGAKPAGDGSASDANLGNPTRGAQVAVGDKPTAPSAKPDSPKGAPERPKR
jgi:hypothetical protein